MPDVHGRTYSAAPTQGFEEYSSDANAVFRTCLDVMSRPGTIQSLSTNLSPPAPMLATTAAVLLTLADFETQIWLDDQLASQKEVAEFVTFHTGAKVTEKPDMADFAVVSDVANMPALRTFAAGSPEYPDRSTTIIIQVNAVSASGVVFRGPGIKDEIQFSVAPEPKDFKQQMHDNRALFPRGVDLFFTNAAHVAALPRSVHVVGEG